MKLILDGGSLAGRLNLVLVSEGYRAKDMKLFRRHAEELSNVIQSEPWYRRGMMNIHTQEVESQDPATWLQYDNGPRNTAFRSEFGGPGKVSRLITGDSDEVHRKIFINAGLDFHVGVLVNSRRHGGRGQGTANMFWTSTGLRWTQSALHEFGHSFGGLRDEYSDDTGKRKRWPTDYEEPRQPNVSADPTGQKWSHITDTVFEGGARYDLGIYRPFETCRMRNMSAPFCAVCEDALVSELESLMENRIEERPKEKEDDLIITTVEDEEKPESHHGVIQDDLMRLAEIRDQAGTNPVGFVARALGNVMFENADLATRVDAIEKEMKR